MNQLTRDNFLKGFLIDEELMGGVSPSKGSYLAFILRHTTGEYLGTKEFEDLDQALSVINSVERPWQYESASQCGGNACNEGNCGTGSCKKILSKQSDCCS